MDTSSVKFKMQLVLKDCSVDFGIGPGVLLTQHVSFDAKILASPTWLVVNLDREEQALIERNITVITTQIEEFSDEASQDRNHEALPSGATAGSV